MSCPSAHLSKFAALALLCAAFAGAQNPPPEIDRLTATGRLWITVKYFHPYLAYRSIDWDQALVDALPKIRSAQTSGDYEAAVRSLVKVLEGEPQPASGGQRVWIHHGLPPEAGPPSAHFYSAFLSRPGDAAEEVSVPMGGFSVTVRLSEPVAAASVPAPPAARVYPEAYPSSELRILAAYKIWGVFHYFFAYRDLMDEDWEALLAQFLPRLLDAKDALAYHLAIAEWLTRVADSQVKIESETMTRYFGEAPVGLRLRIVEKHVVVTEVLDPAAATAGIKVGDIVKKVDGESLVDRFKREEQYVPASTLQRLGVDVIDRILNGPEGSKAALTVEDQHGERKDITLERSVHFRALPSDGALKLLRGGIGYADLRKLQPGEVDGMFDKFRHAPAIVFDMRGEPAGDSISLIAPRLTGEPDVPAAIVTGPIAAAPDLPQGSVTSPSASYFFLETIGHSAQWKYRGKTAMLVDERTIAAGEQAGLFLEAANKTEFIGTPTAGANSVLTNFTVPGGITITLSGEDIRHANGGKLQRMGLQPNVNAAPTLNGIRTGKDEVLEKALDYLSPKPGEGKTLPARAAR